MDMSGDAFFDIMQAVGKDLFTAVNTHGGKLGMAFYQPCFNYLFHHLSS